MQFSAAPDLAAALVVGAASPGQVLANVTSMSSRIPPEFWDELRTKGLIEPTAPVPQETMEPA
jgi:D-threo-aldose 1-dehydrogenase